VETERVLVLVERVLVWTEGVLVWGRREGFGVDGDVMCTKRSIQCVGAIFSCFVTLDRSLLGGARLL